MKPFILALSATVALPVLLAAPWNARASEAPSARPTVSAAAQQAMKNFKPFTDARLANVDAEPHNWPLSRRGPNQWGYSPLKQITPENVHQLTLAWSAGLAPQRNEQEPHVIDGIMFVLGGEAKALDATTGETIWSFDDDGAEFLSGARSLSVYRDRVIYPAAGTRVVSINAYTGQKVWEVDTFDGIETTEEHVKAHRFSAGPQVGNGKVFVGTMCMFKTVPCFVAGIDADTGKLLWRRSSIAQANDPKNVLESWEGVPAEKRFKGSFWGTGSFDPKTNVTYWGSASPAPYPEIIRGKGTGDAKWTNSTLAIDTNTGKLKWAFQHLPRDNWDADISGGARVYRDGQRVQPDASLKWFNPAIKNGATHNVIYAIGKPGVLWVLDRDTGEFLWAKETEYQNIYKSIDGKGKVTLNDEVIPKKIGQGVTVCPSTFGTGILWQTHAYSPDTNALYITQHHRCSVLTPIEDPTGPGFRVGGAPMPGAHPTDISELIAVDASTGKTLWSYKQPAMMWSTVSTAGGLLFVGDSQRNFMAFDARTGKKVWQLPLSGPVTGIPISYAVNGRQFVTVSVGGAMGATMTDFPAGRPNNVILMTFALPEGAAASR